MDVTTLMQLLHEAPITLVAVLLMMICFQIRGNTRRLDSIETGNTKRLDMIEKKIETMASKKDIEEIKENIEDTKKRLVWIDVFNGFKEAVCGRLLRVENVLNGRLKD